MACQTTSIGCKAPQNHRADSSRRWRMTMMWNWKRSIIGGFALTVAVALAVTVASASARADHRYAWDGVALGGFIGGAIGSTIGKGTGRAAAIGAGALLGSLYGHYLTEGKRAPRAHHRPAHRPHRWHGHRSYHHEWFVPRYRRNHAHHGGHHHGWGQPHVYTPAPTLLPSEPLVVYQRPVVVRQQPVVVHQRPPDQPPEAAVSSDYLIAGTSSPASRERGNAVSECRVLEEGVAPVYACRDGSGAWHILH